MRPRRKCATAACDVSTVSPAPSLAGPPISSRAGYLADRQSTPAPHLEYRTYLELEVLDAVTGSFLQRITVAQFQRPHRGVPGDPDADRITERFELRLQADIANHS